jgi:hypothetical protein
VRNACVQYFLPERLPEVGGIRWTAIVAPVNTASYIQWKNTTVSHVVLTGR